MEKRAEGGESEKQVTRVKLQKSVHLGWNNSCGSVNLLCGYTVHLISVLFVTESL